MVQIMQQSGQNHIIRQCRKLVRGKYIVNGKEKSSVQYCVLETGKRKGKIPKYRYTWWKQYSNHDCRSRFADGWC